MDNRRPYDEEDGDDSSTEWTPGSLEDARAGEQQPFLPVPSLFTSPPPIIDALITDTTRKRHNTIEQCLPYLSGTNESPPRFNSQSVPQLEREKHVAFLQATLHDAKFMAYDASRPWVVYWSLCGLSLLGEDVEVYLEKVVKTFAPNQNTDGGFGGGHGQLSHLAPSYAVVLSLAMVGGSESLGLIDRRAMWRWLSQLKQKDGGFRVCIGGEEDVRGAYCAMTIIALLNLPLTPHNATLNQAHGFSSFAQGLPEYLSRCQTFEGGISDKPQNEAHGAYVFCALACLCILGPPHEMLPKYLDLPLLMSWLSARQYAPEGGFSGRTNKLVDGCYSHWVGGCWPLLQAALNRPQSSQLPNKPPVGNLYSEEGLIRYILSCCQAKGGGLRDKPYLYPDGYHSCYVLAGLSSTQYYNDYSGTCNTADDNRLNFAMHWTCNANTVHGDECEPEKTIDARDKLVAVHPIYVIPWAAAVRCHDVFRQTGL